jgi:hypothetical protein
MAAAMTKLEGQVFVLQGKVEAQQSKIDALLKWSENVVEKVNHLEKWAETVTVQQQGYDVIRGIGFADQKTFLHPCDASGFEVTPGPTRSEIHIKSCH